LEDYEKFLSRYPPRTTLPPRGERDAAGLCYTSGTTGRLKGVLYSHRALVLHSLAEAVGIGPVQGDAVMPVVPMFHVNAWGFPYTLTMLGARQVLPGPHLDPESLIDLMQQEQVTLAAGVPSIWLGILEALERNPGRWNLSPRLRMVIGGSAVPESMIRRFDRLAIRVVQGYGMTETSPVLTLSTPKAEMQGWAPDRLYSLLARQGLPLPFVDLRIRGEHGDLPWDGKSAGELEVRSPWVARSYFDENEQQGKWTEDGWLKTGDVATIDSEGYVEIVDRVKDLVKSDECVLERDRERTRRTPGRPGGSGHRAPRPQVGRATARVRRAQGRCRCDGGGAPEPPCRTVPELVAARRVPLRPRATENVHGQGIETHPARGAWEVPELAHVRPMKRHVRHRPREGYRTRSLGNRGFR